MDQTNVNVARLRLQLAKASPRPLKITKPSILNKELMDFIRSRNRLLKIADNIKKSKAVQSNHGSDESRQGQMPQKETLVPEVSMTEPRIQNQVRICEFA